MKGRIEQYLETLDECDYPVWTPAPEDEPRCSCGHRWSDHGDGGFSCRMWFTPPQCDKACTCVQFDHVAGWPVAAWHEATWFVGTDPKEWPTYDPGAWW